MKIALFIPCLVDQVAPITGLAVKHVLEHLGHTVEYNPSQTCCGQALFNMGFADEIRPLAERFIRLFSDAEAVVSPSGSCVSMVVNRYGELNLSGSCLSDWDAMRKRVFEFSSFLVDKLKITDVGAVFPHRVSIHNSCHALRELGIIEQPQRLLRAVRGLELVSGDWEDECCGFGGAFSVKYSALSNRIADRRAATLSVAGAEYITGVDDSCLHHLNQAFQRLNLPQRTIHIARILAANGKAKP